MSKAKLPGLAAVPTGNAALDRWVQAVAERLEVREGARGDADEQVITRRDLKTMGVMPAGATQITRLVSWGAAPRETVTYTPDESPAVPDKVKEIVSRSLADEAAKRGADIQRLEYKLSNATESLSYTVAELTAAIEGVSAGYRQTAYAGATANQATAGQITQLAAALDGTGSATLTESLVVIASRTAGLRAQYMINLTAGKSVSGFGLLNTEDPGGTTDSAFVVQADSFSLAATYTYTQSATPSATVIGQTWYNTTTKLSYRATATGTGSWVAYAPIVPFYANTATGKVNFTADVAIDGALLVSGSVTAGSLTATAIDGKTITGAVVKYGKTSVSDTAAGYYIGSTGQFNFGNSTKYFKFDGSTFTLNGDVVSTSNIVDNAVSVRTLATYAGPLNYSSANNYSLPTSYTRAKYSADVLEGTLSYYLVSNLIPSVTVTLAAAAVVTFDISIASIKSSAVFDRYEGTYTGRHEYPSTTAYVILAFGSDHVGYESFAATGSEDNVPEFIKTTFKKRVTLPAGTHTFSVHLGCGGGIPYVPGTNTQTNVKLTGLACYVEGLMK